MKTGSKIANGRYRDGFMSKMSEAGVPQSEAERLFDWRNQTYTRGRAFEPFEFEHDNVSLLDQRSGPGFMERNQWLARPLMNFLSRKYGNGNRVLSVNFKF